MLLLLTFMLLAAPLAAAEENFAGAAIGVSTLSADGRDVLDASRTSVSLYKPENGFTFMLFSGRHFTEYFSAQASYGWNRNGLALTEVRVASGAETTRVRAYSATMQTFVAEAMLYFRPRSSRVRPYLSAGPGVTHLASGAGATALFRGPAPPPAAPFSSTGICLRVAVGADVAIRRGASFRYSFAETIQNNSISEQLSPPGQRNLANFQNLFGFFWRF